MYMKRLYGSPQPESLHLEVFLIRTNETEETVELDCPVTYSILLNQTICTEHVSTETQLCVPRIPGLLCVAIRRYEVKQRTTGP